MGTLDIASRSPHRFTSQDLELLQSVGNQIGMALENIGLYSEAKRQSGKLRSLNEAGLILTSELSTDVVLQKVVDLSRELGQARYAALGVLNEEGEIGQFLTSGLDPGQRTLVGAPHKGQGLLGVLRRQGRPLRVSDISEDPRSRGFPANHPPMKSFLGVPITYKSKTIGNLYLADKVDADDFTLEDQEAISMLAAQAAISIENARLYHQVQNAAILQERDRIAREMHDGLAQGLAYLNLKIDHLEDLLSSNEAEQVMAHLQEELEKMRKVVDDAYSDVRESIVGLRSSMNLESGLLEELLYGLQQFSEQNNTKVSLIADGVNLSHLVMSSQIQLVRIIQEALTNVRKHARASRAWLRFSANENMVSIVIEDNGCGFDWAAISRPGRQHFGLHIMRERAESLGGTFSVESSFGGGTRVMVTMPLILEKDWHQHGNGQ